MLPHKSVILGFITVLTLITPPLSAGFRVPGNNPTSQLPTAPKQTRRALLVGINHYKQNEDFGNLKGALRDTSDLGQLLATRYGFQVQTLPEEKATRDGIVAAFRQHLVTDANEGDVCLFFFAGHGTQIKNSSSPEEDNLDEAIVPIDVRRPVTEKKSVKEIRDKELARLYNEALSKGVKLVVIFDSCHSGSTARGVNSGRVRRIDALLTVDMAVPPDPPDLVDPKNKDGRSPEERGALVMAASLDNESAEEHLYDGVYRGDFSKALFDILRESDANKISAQQIFLNISARLSHDTRAQHPTLGRTREERRNLTLFGDQPSDDTGQTPVTVIVDDPTQTIVIQNGADIGLTRGSEFKRKDGPPLRIRISEEVTELSSAFAEVIPPGKLSDTKTGEFFQQDKWASGGKPNLTVWLPPAKLSAAEIRSVAIELSQLRSSDKVQWIDDPTQKAATHVVSFEEAGWQLAKSDGTSVNLGAQPTVAAVLKMLSITEGKPRVFVHLPPSKELGNRIKLGEGTAKSAIAVTRARDEALYLLVGRLGINVTPTVEYAWVLPAATQGDAKDGKITSRAESLPLPPLTSWIDVGAAAVANQDPVSELEDMALRLGKIKGWLGLTSPRQVKGHGFPYRLVIRNADSNAEIHNGGELVECEKYSVELVADPSSLNPQPAPRYVYLLNLDKYGNSTLLYGDGSESNKLPLTADLSSGKVPIRIALKNATFIVTGPEGRCVDQKTGHRYGKGILGNETYILVTSEEPLRNPELLMFEGVKTAKQIAAEEELERQKKERGERSVGGNEDLQKLLSSIGGPTLATRGTTSLTWSVQHLSFRSVEKK